VALILVAARVSRSAPLPDALPPSLRTPPAAAGGIAAAGPISYERGTPDPPGGVPGRHPVDRSAPLPLPSPPSSPERGAPPAPPLSSPERGAPTVPAPSHVDQPWPQSVGAHQPGVQESYQHASTSLTGGGEGGGAERADSADAGASTEWTSFGADDDGDSSPDGGTPTPSPLNCKP
jgi:hypothetical protein